MRNYILIIVIILTIPLTTYAGSTNKKVTDNKLESAPEIKVSEDIIKYNLGEFSGQGWIDQIQNNDIIIINDTIFTLSPKIKKLDIYGQISTKNLKAGMHVYYLLDKRGKIIKIITGKLKI